MNALDYKVTNHHWGGRVLVLFLFCPRLRTKVEQKWTKRTKREHPMVWQICHCCLYITVAIMSLCCIWATVWQLCNNGVWQICHCCRIATNISKVCVSVPIEYSLALFLLVMRLVNGCIYRYAFDAYGPKTLSEARWCALAKRLSRYLKINCANVA